MNSFRNELASENADERLDFYFENDNPPSTSKAKANSFLEEKGWTPFTIMRRLGVLLASAMVLSVSYGSIVGQAVGRFHLSLKTNP